jgi:hypothetical protein
MKRVLPEKKFQEFQKSRNMEDRKLLADQLAQKFYAVRNSQGGGGNDDDDDDNAVDDEEKDAMDEKNYYLDDADSQNMVLNTSQKNFSNAKKGHGRLLMKIITKFILLSINLILEHPLSTEDSLSLCFSIYLNSVRLSCFLSLSVERSMLIRAVVVYSRLFHMNLSQKPLTKRYVDAVYYLILLGDPDVVGNFHSDSWPIILQVCARVNHLFTGERDEIVNARSAESRRDQSFFLINEELFDKLKFASANYSNLIEYVSYFSQNGF